MLKRAKQAAGTAEAARARRDLLLVVVLVLVTACRRSPPDAGASTRASSEAPTPPVPPAQAPQTKTPITAPEAPPPPDPSQAGTCRSGENDDPKLGLLVSPLRAVAGRPLRILAATLTSTSPLAMRIETAKGETLEVEAIYRAGVPAMTVARLIAPKGTTSVRVIVGQGGKALKCTTVHVFPNAAPSVARNAREKNVWPVARNWSIAEEALYSAFIREMFRAPRGDDLSFARLDEVTSNPAKNLLFDHYGWGEDSSKKGLSLKPDCADTPYFLRAYFAWKRALPFAYRHCGSGDDSTPPRCGKPRTVLEPADVPSKLPTTWNELTQVARFFQRSLGEVHTGNTRVPFGDEENDFYGLELTRRALRPGAVYADPYGHVYSVVEFVEPEGSLPGVLYAVDGQPDGSITRKRFWEGNFLWNQNPVLGGSGFKAFRPLTVKYEEGEQIIVSATDAQIAQNPDYHDVSSRQSKLGADAFYDAMDRLITPTVRDAFVAQEEMARALSEAAKVRVTSVNNAAGYFAEHEGEVIALPAGAEIFESTGPWEDFSTPSRDLRLLIAMDVINHFEDKIARQPEAFAPWGSNEDRQRRLTEERKRLLESDELAISYKRSDGSMKKLSLADLVTRAATFEAAYNPNDCPEHRWGAPEGSEERSTCKRRAPEEQQAQMDGYKKWFHERKRPPRAHLPDR